MRDQALAAFLVTGERLAEMHDAVEPRQQDLSERDAADRAMPADRIVSIRQLAVDRKQNLHLLGQEPNGAARPAAGALERLKQRRGQAGMQGAAAGRVDVHPITLHPVRGRVVALVKRDADPCQLEPLRQREPPDAAADDDDMAKGLAKGLANGLAKG